MLSGKTPKIQYLQCGTLAGCYSTRANLVWTVVLFKVNIFLCSILGECLTLNAIDLISITVSDCQKLLILTRKIG